MSKQSVNPCHCGNCNWRGAEQELAPIRDMEERVLPGEEVPAGECPQCGALAYNAEEFVVVIEHDRPHRRQYSLGQIRRVGGREMVEYVTDGKHCFRALWRSKAKAFAHGKRLGVVRPQLCRRDFTVPTLEAVKPLDQANAQGLDYRKPSYPDDLRAVHRASIEGR